MKIHKEGHSIILLTITVVAITIALVVFLANPKPVYILIVSLTGLLLVIVTVLFFRVPARFTDQHNNVIYSGADGRVVVIEEVQETEYFNDRRIQVSVFMSVTNVHVNFAPCSGKVAYFKYHPGKHLFAWLPKSSKENERTSLVIMNETFGPVLMHQVAGAFARRIVCYPKVEDNLYQGQEIGIIKFGSRVDLFLPVHANVKVNLNQCVTGGKTIIAEIQH